MYADTERGARYSEVLPGDHVLVQQGRKDKLSTRFNPSPYTVVNCLINYLSIYLSRTNMESQEGVQYSRNTSHVKKLLRNNVTPSTQEETVTETQHKEEEPIQQQSVAQEPNVAEPEVPLRRSQRHRAAPSYLKDYCT